MLPNQTNAGKISPIFELSFLHPRNYDCYCRFAVPLRNDSCCVHATEWGTTSHRCHRQSHSIRRCSLITICLIPVTGRFTCRHFPDKIRPNTGGLAPCYNSRIINPRWLFAVWLTGCAGRFKLSCVLAVLSVSSTGGLAEHDNCLLLRKKPFSEKTAVVPECTKNVKIITAASAHNLFQFGVMFHILFYWERSFKVRRNVQI